jgi:hypothetical protein
MKNTKSLCLGLLFTIAGLNNVNAQFGGLKDKLLKVGTAQGAKALGVDKF